QTCALQIYPDERHHSHEEKSDSRHASVPPEWVDPGMSLPASGGPGRDRRVRGDYTRLPHQPEAPARECVTPPRPTAGIAEARGETTRTEFRNSECRMGGGL